MSNNLSWQRCQTCGQLALAPAATAICWRCGATRFDHAPTAIGITPFVPVDPPAADADHDGASQSLPAIRTDPFPSRFTLLTQEEAATARRLLAQVFPDEIEV